jgi:hypothetical protein
MCRLRPRRVWRSATPAHSARFALLLLSIDQAYRDWEVKIHDWQSQCSMLADAEGLRCTLRRLMPTVGCEADAVAFTEEAQQVFAAQQAAASPIDAEGAYTHGPGDLASPELFEAAAEHCLPLAAGQRLRVVHNLKRMGADRSWRVLGIELHRERRDGPHTGRRELAGCGGGMELFSQQPAVARGALDGAWAASGVRFEADGAGGLARSAVEGRPWSADTLPGVVCLPLGAWSWAEVGGEGASLAAGVLLDDGSMRVAVRRVRGGEVEAAELLTLRRV